MEHTLSIQTFCQIGESPFETCLKVNGEIRMYMYSGSQYRGSGSNMALLKLKVGDIVNIVKHGSGGLTPFYIHRRWSTFSGFLLVSD
jgi:hypothetical protein